MASGEYPDRQFTGMIGLSARIRLILSLVHRDYAMQFAGTSMGLLWLIIQYVFQIGVFYVIFGVVLSSGGNSAGRFFNLEGVDYLSYLLGGMCLWIPLSEMLIRSCQILVENRALIRRTSVGAGAFVWVPIFEGLIHYLILFIPITVIGYFRGTLSVLSPLAFVLGMAIILGMSGWGFILARISVLVRDTSPIVRLLLQVIFWLTPIVYAVGSPALRTFALNPFYAPIELHRALLFSSPGQWPPRIPLWNGTVALILLSIPIYRLSAVRLNAIIVDHL